MKSYTSVAYGGAISYRSSGVLTVSGTLFDTNCTTRTSADANGCGGAVSLKYGTTYGVDASLRGKATFMDCVFKNNGTAYLEANSRHRGGAIALTVGSDNRSLEDVRIDKCVFTGNSATQGGAILVHGNGSYQDATFYVNDCVFDGNYANFRTGTVITFFYLGELGINNCSFRGGYSLTSQAATNLSGINITDVSNTVLSNSTIIGQPGVGEGCTEDYENGNLVRLETTKTGIKYTLVNNIIASTKSWCKSLMSTGGAPTIVLKSNKLSPLALGSISPQVDDSNGTDWLGTADCFGALSWVSGDDISPANTYWSWNGTLDGGTPLSLSSLSQVKADIQTASPAFYDWLGSASVNGLERDQRNIKDRSGNVWPGAYQN